MKIDDTAAAYGLIQIVFADITDRLSTALYALLSERDSRITPMKVHRKEFGRFLKEFKTELKQFDGQGSVDCELHELREACHELASLATWRNDRIHARVRQESDGFALYDWRTGKRLSMNGEECNVVIQTLVKIIGTFDATIPHLIHSLEADKAFEALFNKLGKKEAELLTW
jgi:hypothetical protein